MEHQPLTKKDLDESLEHFAGIVNAGFQDAHDRDMKLDAKIDAVKAELTEQFNTKIDALKTDMDTKMDTLKTNMDTLKTELLDSNDAIARQITDNRQEQAAVVGGHQRIDDTLLAHDDTIKEHDKRIGALEAARIAAW